MKENILVTGSNGQLGRELQLLQSLIPNYNLLFFDSKLWNITDDNRSHELFSLYKPKILINCAAYTAVDLAESQVELAYAINSNAVNSLSQICADTNTLLIHISTDYVFHGNSAEALKEDSPKNPQGIYAKSKSKGEDYIIASKAKYLIIRTSWVYSQFGSNFVKTMLKLAETKTELSVVNDQLGCPTHAASIARFLTYLLTHFTLEELYSKTGIYHYSDANPTNWNAFAKKIFELTNRDIRVNAISTAAFNAKANRPLFSVLNTEKVKKTFEYIIDDWEVELKKCLALLNE